jgi:hypothetical protein
VLCTSLVVGIEVSTVEVELEASGGTDASIDGAFCVSTGMEAPTNCTDLNLSI